MNEFSSKVSCSTERDRLIPWKPLCWWLWNPRNSSINFPPTNTISPTPHTIANIPTHAPIVNHIRQNLGAFNAKDLKNGFSAVVVIRTLNTEDSIVVLFGLSCCVCSGKFLSSVLRERCAFWVQRGLVSVCIDCVRKTVKWNKMNLVGEFLLYCSYYDMYYCPEY